MKQLKEVELVATSIFLPGDPVPFEKIESVIGELDQVPPRMKRMISKLRPTVKDLIGIEQCYFALDPKTQDLTESNVSMLVKAIKGALAKAKMGPEEIDALFLGTAVSEHQTPPLTTIVQEELGIENCAEIEIHSNCTGITKAFQVAFDALRLGRYKTIVIGYSQLSSAYLRSKFYNQELIKPENILLRWFLSDSACAIVLSAKDTVSSGVKVLDVYNESLGGKLPAAMWMPIGSKHLHLDDTYKEGKHHLGQNYKAVVNEVGEPIFVKGFQRMKEKCSINPGEIDKIIATIPSTLLLNKAKAAYLKNFSIQPEKWYSNIPQYGYSGSSSIIVALDELLDSNQISSGSTLVSITIESSKWIFGGFVLKYI